MTPISLPLLSLMALSAFTLSNPPMNLPPNQLPLNLMQRAVYVQTVNQQQQFPAFSAMMLDLVLLSSILVLIFSIPSVFPKRTLSLPIYMYRIPITALIPLSLRLLVLALRLSLRKSSGPIASRSTLPMSRRPTVW